MAILTKLKGIPLFSTPLEAINWGRRYGLTGYHSHAYNIKTGYMGGSNHSQAAKATYNRALSASAPTPPVIPPPIPIPAPVAVPTPVPTPIPIPIPIPTPTTTPTTPPVSGGGGGY